MSRTQVIEKINQMPEALIGAVSEYLDTLMEGYRIGKMYQEEPFSEEELGELDKRYEEMIATPSAAIPVEDVLKFMREKHGL